MPFLKFLHKSSGPPREKINENSCLRGAGGLWYNVRVKGKQEMMNTFKFAWFYYFGFTAGAARVR